ncbi:hypothetical protein [Variovorax sp. RA8]|uniref:hypothetical protein n=1 Tax=Variovorax sp. (strain JCM 16519 / RA8) TaxID=662548 RepID=UPI000ACBE6A0|nr:hypothetical protein [Variovorax sp. RA8]VTU34531.1 hypothetical protein RA8CHR_04992 [Variovorax sp. RA8]
MNIQTFIFTASQAIEINKDLESLDDRNDQMNYSIFRNNQERYKKLTGLTLSSHEAITEAELEYFEEMNKEPEEEISTGRFAMLNQLFIRTLQNNHVAA